MLVCVSREQKVLDILNAYRKDNFELKNVVEMNRISGNELATMNNQIGDDKLNKNNPKKNSECNFLTLRKNHPKFTTLESLRKGFFASLM